MKNIRMFYLKICHFLVVKFSVYLNRRVYVMFTMNRYIQYYITSNHSEFIFFYNFTILHQAWQRYLLDDHDKEDNIFLKFDRTSDQVKISPIYHH